MNGMMKAMLCRKYGPPEVFELAQIPIPVPGANEILVKVHATSVTAASILLRSGVHPHYQWMTVFLRLMYGCFKPRRTILGYEFSGTVVAVGNNVTNYQPGDAVYGTTMGLKQGAYAEYLCVPEQWKSGVLRKKPASVSMEQAAVFPVGAMTALYLLRKAGNLSEKSVLVIGASGSVGTYAVQLAYALGASKVSGVCADHKINAFNAWGGARGISRSDFEKNAVPKNYDLVFDVSGLWTRKRVKNLLTANGQYITINTFTHETQELFSAAEALLIQGRVIPLVDKTFSLEELPAAHHYAVSGDKFGNIAIIV